MAFSLPKIGKKITDILGTAADAVIPGDQSSWHAPRPVAPVQRQNAANIGTQFGFGPQAPVPLPIHATQANPALGTIQSISSSLFNRAVTNPSLPHFTGDRAHDTVELAKAGDIGAGSAAGLNKGITQVGVKPIVGLVKKGLSSAKNILQDESGFIGQPRLGGKFAPGVQIHPEDLKVMTNYIDHARGVTKVPPNKAAQLELDASRIAEHYNLPMPKTAGGLANSFDRRIQTTPGLLSQAKAILKDEGGYLGLPGKGKPTVSLRQSEQNLAGSSLPKSVTRAKNGALQGVKTALSDQDQVILDELRSVEKQTGQKGLVNKFMYNSNQQRGSNAIANQVLSNSPNLQKAIGGLSKNDYRAFSEYANARTELGSAGDKTPLSRPKQELQSIVDQGNAAHGTRFEALNQHFKELADTAYEAGLISKETLNKYKANNDYVRIQRDMGDLLPNQFGKGNGYSLGSTVMGQKRTGSKRDILPAGETAAEYTQQIYREAARNKTGTHLMDTLNKYGSNQKLGSAKAATHENVVRILRDGKTEFYRVSPEIKQAVNNINPYSMNVVTQILAAPGRVLRAGVTGLNPVFIARNLLKDQVGTAINSEHLLATHNPSSFLHGLMSATKDAVGKSNDPIYQDFLKHYGDTTSYDLTRNVKNTKEIVNRIRGGKAEGAKQALLHPVRSLENIASITEKSTRFQNYRGEYLKAIKHGAAPEQASERAAIAAWQNSVDFSRAGTWGRAINTVVPYWNPATQGVRQMGRTLAKHPIKSSVTATALVGVPLATATAWNLSSPDTQQIYDNIPEYEKENNLILIPPGTTQNKDGSYDLLKIPLAPGWKDVFMPVRRAMEAFSGDKPAEFGKMATDILQAVGGPVSVQSPGAAAGSFIPQAVKPVIQQYANQDLFSGNKIVPDYMQNATNANGDPVSEAQKAYKGSSGTARVIGNASGVSPVRIEKGIKDVAGSVGLQTLNAVDTGAAKVGLIPKDQIGGQSVAEGLKKSFGSAQGIENANASEGAKYYKVRQEVTKGLNGNEQAAFTALHPDKKNFLGDPIMDSSSTYNPAARLDVYNRFPKVFQADKNLDASQRKQGRPGNPLYDLPMGQVKKVLEHDNLPPGAKDPELSKLFDQSWYADYAAKKSAYFTQLKGAADKAGKPWDTSKNPYPVTPPNVQAVMDTYAALPDTSTGATKNKKAYKSAHPEMAAQLAKIDAWQNVQRGARGLAATEGDVGKAAGFGQAMIMQPYTPTGSSSRGGSSASYAISSGAGGGFRKQSVSIRKPSTKKVARVSKGKSNSGKPVVSIKRSKV